ncbi:MAG: cardiolipin synthase [Proteobacteria bacterium]|nr:cardiolipin synthase [Pseudomonadota bacterium]MBU1641658.1 cardiolipin synthase [Pseudomonadota bacterium]
MFLWGVDQRIWPYLLTMVGLAITLATAVHILLQKKDTRSATGWLGLVWFSPLFGVGLYWLLGVNRIKRRAKTRYASREIVPLPDESSAVSASYVEECICKGESGLAMLCRLTEKVTRQPLMRGNTIVPLVNGDQAYPLMLAQIKKAKHSISLCSYIFANDRWGNTFREALHEARKSGVEVRVLVDGVGARYSLPPITWRLRKDGIPAACFMQTLLPWRFRYLNLRNHRKLLVIDGKTGFTGGMNIQDGNVLDQQPRSPIQDIHFHIKGPVVAALQKIFAEDWAFTTGEKLCGEAWFPHIAQGGAGVARGIADGPDEDFDKIHMVILGALASARKTIQIATPYFLPESGLVTGLRIAALRGVDVQILLPSEPNLRMVKWASDAGLDELLDAGCKVYKSAAPFDHSKMMIVDQAWVLMGSANWDTRSLALNFEFNVECYDRELASSLQQIFDRKVSAAKQVLLDELMSRNLASKMRNKLFRLFLPYL